MDLACFGPATLVNDYLPGQLGHTAHVGGKEPVQAHVARQLCGETLGEKVPEELLRRTVATNDMSTQSVHCVMRIGTQVSSAPSGYAGRTGTCSEKLSLCNKVT